MEKHILAVVLLSVIISNAVSFGIIFYSWNRLYKMTVLDNQRFLKELGSVFETKEK